MATSRYGFGATAPKTDRKTASSTHTIVSSRVRGIILDDSNKELFNKYGGWNGIGTIFIESAKSPVFNDKIPLVPAYPAFPNIKHYPLINELVPIIYLTDIDSTSNTTSVSAYYLPPINVWNSITHNGIPSSNILPESQTKNYQQVEAGSTNIISDQSTEINLGQTFNENNVSNIHPLLPYEGDIIYEGRFGNSVRLGSTVNNAKIPNNWSSVGENGSPIFILRNGQGRVNTESWVPTTENVNLDDSSIYLTSTQQIPLAPASYIEDSYAKSTRPEDVSKYSKNQIILNSGRLVFNAKNDSIILGAAKSIHLTSDTSVNIDGGKQIAVVAPKVYLGSAKGIEDGDLQSLVLGENLMTNLLSLAISLQGVATALTTAIAGPYPVASLNTIGPQLEATCTDIINEIKAKSMLSKQVKTK